jgi:hypothetical protein
MYRRNRIAVCAVVAIVATIVGACGSSSTFTNAKPARGFTSSTVEGHIDIRGGLVRTNSWVELNIDYSCPRDADGTTGGMVLTTVVQPQLRRQLRLSGGGAVTCDGNTHSKVIGNTGDAIVLRVVDAYASLFQSPQSGPQMAVVQTKHAELHLS